MCDFFHVLKNENAIKIHLNMGHPARNYHDAVAFTLMNYAMS